MVILLLWVNSNNIILNLSVQFEIVNQLPKIILAKLKFGLNLRLFLWCRSTSCRDDLYLFHRRPLWLATSYSWWNIHLSSYETGTWFKNKLDKDIIPPISTRLWKMTQEFRKSTAFIPIKLSRPDLEDRHVATVACP